MRLFRPDDSVQGWHQFLTARKAMLDAYDAARQKGVDSKVKVAHGRVAEAEFRKWLSEFLPRRYAVTSGYIVSAGQPAGTPMPHFDVIIYDCLSAPILWVEENPDHTNAGKSQAIPAEHVLAVLEVKSAINARHAKEAMSHLSELQPLTKPRMVLGRYPSSLPANFCCGVVFFELRRADEHSLLALKRIARPPDWLRGYFGAVILRAEGKRKPESGRFYLSIYDQIDRPHPIGKSLYDEGDLLVHRLPNEQQSGGFLVWLEAGFSVFAFDLLAMLEGRYRPGKLSSKHAIGASP